MDDLNKLAIIEKQQENLNILRELASNESNDGAELHIFGHIEGIPIGTTWLTRSDCSKSGVHRPLLDCVHYRDNGVYSLILENTNPQDADLGDWFTYTGDSDPTEEVEVHSFSRSSLALIKNSKSGLPVRIVRSVKLSTSLTQYAYRYDGLYVVRKYWEDVDVLTGKNIFKCAFQRCKNQSSLPCPIENKKTRKNEKKLQKKKPQKTKQNILSNYNRVKQENVEVDCNLIPVGKIENSCDNKVYKKLCKSDTDIYKECYIKVKLLSHQYLYDKYSISVNEFRNCNFNAPTMEKKNKTCNMSGFPLKRNHTSGCEVNKEHKIIKLQREIRSSSLTRPECLTGQVRNLVDVEDSEGLSTSSLRQSAIRCGSKSKLDDQNIHFSNQRTSAHMHLNIESKRGLLNKYVSTRPKSINSSSDFQEKDISESDSDSCDLLQLRISPPINYESAGSMPSDTEEELFAGFNSKCYFYQNKVIVEFNGKVHVCNEHNYFLSDENDFSVLCEDDRETSYHDFQGEVYSL